MKLRKNHLGLIFQIDLILILLILSLSFTACGKKDEVVGTKTSDSITAPPTIYHKNFACSQHTIIRPTVDFLFLWDNSSSGQFINSETKASLQNTINLISPRFDYHIVLAPLKISPGNEGNFFLMTENTDGLNELAKNKIISSDSMSKIEAFKNIQQEAGSIEAGFQRVIDLLGNNQENGIFRKGVYTFVILMSNGDDNSYVRTVDNSPSGATKNFQKQKDKITEQVKKLQSEQFRFITIVANSDQCPKQGFTQGHFYKQMSNYFFNQLPTDYKTAFEKDIQDSYDICGINFNHIFDGPNQTIQDITVKHVYKYWPMATTQDPSFDPKKIIVTKNTGVELIENDPNGFKYIGMKTDWPTREVPSPGENFTGHLIEMMGNGKVTFPECLHIKTQEPADFYGFIAMDKNPNLDTLIVEINGTPISRDESKANGWSYLGYQVSKNIKIKNRTDFTPQLPAVNKSGYFIQLHGNAIYTNGDRVNFSFRPAPL